MVDNQVNTRVAQGRIALKLTYSGRGQKKANQHQCRHSDPLTQKVPDIPSMPPLRDAMHGKCLVATEFID